jgi:hypothetical protein
MFAHDLRANAYRVCREGKPLHTFPDHALVRDVTLSNHDDPAKREFERSNMARDRKRKARIRKTRGIGCSRSRASPCLTSKSCLVRQTLGAVLSGRSAFLADPRIGARSREPPDMAAREISLKG